MDSIATYCAKRSFFAQKLSNPKDFMGRFLRFKTIRSMGPTRVQAHQCGYGLGRLRAPLLWQIVRCATAQRQRRCAGSYMSGFTLRTTGV